MVLIPSVEGIWALWVLLLSMLKVFMIKASRSVVRNANQQPGAVCVGSGASVAFACTLVASERIAFSADRLDSLQVLKEQAL
ncbi:hypothetical protein D3C75_1156600 [compost metagenome]